MSSRLYHTVDSIVNSNLPKEDNPVYRLTLLAQRLGFSGNELREVEATYHRHLIAYDESMPTARSILEAGSQQEERRTVAYAATIVYIRKKIDAWHTQADGVRG